MKEPVWLTTAAIEEQTHGTYIVAIDAGWKGVESFDLVKAELSYNFGNGHIFKSGGEDITKDVLFFTPHRLGWQEECEKLVPDTLTRIKLTRKRKALKKTADGFVGYFEELTGIPIQEATDSGIRKALEKYLCKCL